MPWVFILGLEASPLAYNQHNLFMELFIKIILSYLLGSISGSMLLGKFKGIDIRKMGSGNTGGTNAFRTMGGVFALGVFSIDVLKGFISVKLYPIDMIELTILCGISAVIGHVYPIYYGFKGGKGAGPLLGILLALFPSFLIIGLPIWLIVLILSGYVGLSTIIAGIALPICTSIFYTDGIYSQFGFFSVMVAIFISYTHRSNIHRMIEGNENQFKKIMIFRKVQD